MTPESALPPLAPPDASDEERALAGEARWVARHGVAPSMSDFRDVFRRIGADWPGDDEIRQRCFVADGDVISRPAGAPSVAP